MASDPDRCCSGATPMPTTGGERELAAELWQALAVNNFDRVQQIVKAFRFTPGGPGLPEHEWGSAANEAYLRVIAMGAGFRNREIGQFRAALVTCVQNACRDYGRKELRHDRRAAGSFDETFDPEGAAGPMTRRSPPTTPSCASGRARPSSPSSAGSRPSSSSPGRSPRCQTRTTGRCWS